jgi:hypothetical protein
MDNQLEQKLDELVLRMETTLQEEKEDLSDDFNFGWEAGVETARVELCRVLDENSDWEFKN